MTDTVFIQNQFTLTYSEVVGIITECGFNVKEFVEELNISESTFYRRYRLQLGTMPEFVATTLKDFVMQENYLEALHVLRGGQRRKVLPGYKLIEILRFCDRRQGQFAEYLGRTRTSRRGCSVSYISDTLRLMTPTIPLQFIDALENFIGDPDLWPLALEHVKATELLAFRKQVKNGRETDAEIDEVDNVDE